MTSTNGKTPVIVDCVRTPIGRAHKEKGWFRDVRSDDLAVACIKSLVERTGIDPALIDATYAPQISEADQAQIGARPEDELCLRVIVTVGQVPEDTTINLAAPLVLNLDVGLGCQAILDDNAYGLRVPVIRHQD